MRIIVGIILLGLVGCSHGKPVPPGPVPVKPPSPVATLTWNRTDNATDYLLYFCWDGEECRPKASPRGPVQQTPVGVAPSFQIDMTGSVGAVAVTARNAGGESLLSNVVRFDRRQ